MTVQSFLETNQMQWQALEQFPGTQLLPLAEPVHQGSIHRLRMVAGTVIPAHTHPCDEYVQVLEGTVKTGAQVCHAGMFWHTPAGIKQGPHKAITDVEILTIRLGAMGTFENLTEADER